jgi:hypothetical protein
LEKGSGYLLSKGKSVFSGKEWVCILPNKGGRESVGRFHQDSGYTPNSYSISVGRKESIKGTEQYIVKHK